MLTFITGLPGSGKTLYAIDRIMKYRESEHKDALADDPAAAPREVFYYGINELKLDWTPFTKPDEWYKLPKGSIIVMDEVQKIFTTMSSGAKRPLHYTEFDTHRHSGFDIFLITQNPDNVDIRVRSMAGFHYHLIRNYGLQQAELYEFQSVKKITDRTVSKYPDGVHTRFKYPTHVFDLYKSAEVHTHKRTIPWKKVIPIALTFAALLGLIIYGITWAMGKKNQAAESFNRQMETPTDTNTSPTLGQIFKANKPPATLFNDSEQFIEQVNGLPMSKPMYSHLVEVRAIQRIDGCAEFVFNDVTTCTCNDQRGNVLNTTIEICQSVIQTGYFDFTVADVTQPSFTKVYE